MVDDRWTPEAPPTLDEFEAIAAAAYAGLPEQFRALIEDVPFSVDELPAGDVLADLGIADPLDLLGLFHGVGRTQLGDTPPTGQLPNRIHLYRRPILDYWLHHPGLSLNHIVTHVLVHEIGHHFGFSDDDMERIEAGDEENEK